ncbi:transcriptional regulator [uncultured Enterococcus sp.]|uniref:ArsR/SmtB family transcription factor n=1 Tax=uncultured Enterococcus sp. TaxID=167972 RepID=UPI0025FED254|nr:winged helix-turn-helix domain-containing protein [uncultured Enterococcus sp.]
MKFSQMNEMEINWEQQKVLANPTRSKIVAMLYETPMTSKQVADTLKLNPGTTYYHIQQLLKHGILSIHNTETKKGIIEKYYTAKTKLFKHQTDQSVSDKVHHAKTSIFLSETLLEQFNQDMHALLFKYGHLSFNEQHEATQMPYEVEYMIKKIEEE